MTTLSLVKDSKGELFLFSTEASQGAEFSIFDVDGYGGGNPFGFGNTTWVAVNNIAEQEYDADDPDSFWAAHQKIVKECQERGVDLPMHVEIW